MTPSSMLASTSPIASSGGYAGSGTFCVTRIFGRADVLDMVTSKRNILWLLYHLLVEWCARVGQAWTSRAGTSPRPYPITQWLAKPYRVRARACPRPGSCYVPFIIDGRFLAVAVEILIHLVRVLLSIHF